jgi:hypothetical protein
MIHDSWQDWLETGNKTVSGSPRVGALTARRAAGPGGGGSIGASMPPAASRPACAESRGRVRHHVPHWT